MEETLHDASLNPFHAPTYQVLCFPYLPSFYASARMYTTKSIKHYQALSSPARNAPTSPTQTPQSPPHTIPQTAPRTPSSNINLSLLHALPLPDPKHRHSDTA
ncbi:uncharacterized protein K452DRAFT_147380 [Aplosporella prunicola CBS 121167]|uniref:Uncharacterized protein n=1 Tax=Aplosporella prunicola CBS 121167 TaxID=1176127 RepID=A0A6A6BMZ9_9PEZI|nr:uncharacterized protein K452DRAFT_147380 [Aplosporella prunicola CBS 121167]KAF2144783.1 hypothetical protein K452DRAFT_147380 [Aplosporella prunicola CBS 121167]